MVVWVMFVMLGSSAMLTHYIVLQLYITGDPTFFGNLPVHKLMKEAVKDAVDSEKFNGYGPCHGEENYQPCIFKYS